MARPWAWNSGSGAGGGGGGSLPDLDPSPEGTYDRPKSVTIDAKGRTTEAVPGDGETDEIWLYGQLGGPVSVGGTTWWYGPRYYAASYPALSRATFLSLPATPTGLWTAPPDTRFRNDDTLWTTASGNPSLVQPVLTGIPRTSFNKVTGLMAWYEGTLGVASNVVQAEFYDGATWSNLGSSLTIIAGVPKGFISFDQALAEGNRLAIKSTTGTVFTASLLTVGFRLDRA